MWGREARSPNIVKRTSTAGTERANADIRRISSRYLFAKQIVPGYQEVKTTAGPTVALTVLGTMMMVCVLRGGRLIRREIVCKANGADRGSHTVEQEHGNQNTIVAPGEGPSMAIFLHPLPIQARRLRTCAIVTRLTLDACDTLFANDRNHD